MPPFVSLSNSIIIIFNCKYIKRFRACELKGMMGWMHSILFFYWFNNIVCAPCTMNTAYQINRTHFHNDNSLYCSPTFSFVSFDFNSIVVLHSIQIILKSSHCARLFALSHNVNGTLSLSHSLTHSFIYSIKGMHINTHQTANKKFKMYIEIMSCQWKSKCSLVNGPSFIVQHTYARLCYAQIKKKRTW